MTARELNRDIKRLEAKYNHLKDLDFVKYYKELPSFIEEFARLHNADKGAEYMNLSSLKTMIRLNRVLNIIPQHQFFINL